MLIFYNKLIAYSYSPPPPHPPPHQNFFNFYGPALNITRYPVFQNVKEILKDLHILLTPDNDHKHVFDEIPITAFKNNKNAIDHPVRSVLPMPNKEG